MFIITKTPMNTKCNTNPTENRLQFQRFGRRQVVGAFDAGRLSSDGGCVLIRELDQQIDFFSPIVQCFDDHRDPRYVEHSLQSMLIQRVVGLALGYEDLNDHDELRDDSVLALVAKVSDLSGEHRRRERDLGHILASSKTLNRLEHGRPETAANDRYKKLVLQPQRVDRWLVDMFLQHAYAEPPEQIILDLDATDDPVHGQQEGKYFHGYYKENCYLPLYLFCGDFPLLARLNTADVHPSKVALKDLSRVVAQIREHWSQTKIVVRADTGFGSDELMSWCEAQTHVDYVVGMAKNARLKRIIEVDMAKMKQQHQQTGETEKTYVDFQYKTLKSWSQKRRVISKVEYLGKENPRFVVTSLEASELEAKELYEYYCQRGEMENRIKEQQMCLFADRTSTALIRSNQVRLYFSTMAYLLMSLLRQYGLAGTELARARCDTIRLRLLKVAVQIRQSTRKVWLSYSSVYPHQELFRRVLSQLQGLQLGAVA